MRKLAFIISWLALAVIVVLAFACLGGRVTLATLKAGMLVCTVAWFATAPLWMGRHDGR